MNISKLRINESPLKKLSILELWTCFIHQSKVKQSLDLLILWSLSSDIMTSDFHKLVYLWVLFTRTAIESPHRRTTKTPPMLIRFRAEALVTSTAWAGQYSESPTSFPSHHLLYSICMALFSCSRRIACDILSLHLDPLGVAIPYPLLSTRPPIWVRLQSLCTNQSSMEDSQRKA